MAKYSKAASKKVERAMKKRNAGTLKSGRSGKTVKSRKQAIAIGLSEARAEGKKAPKKAAGKKSTAGRKAKTAKKAATSKKTKAARRTTSTKKKAKTSRKRT